MYFKLKNLSLKQRIRLKQKIKNSKNLNSPEAILLFINKYLKRKNLEEAI